MKNSVDQQHVKLKWTISCLAAAALLTRIAFPNLRVDAVSLGFISVAILPWLSPLIKSAELPGGVKIEFQEFKAAVTKAAARDANVQSESKNESVRQFVKVAEMYPDLALVALRIEIERRLKDLARTADVPSSWQPGKIAMQLGASNVIGTSVAAGLRELLLICNQAAHGVRVPLDVARSAIEDGPRVLEMLDAKIEAPGRDG